MRKHYAVLWALLLTMVFSVFACAQAAVTTADSGPSVGKHTEQHYVLDCSTNVVTNGDTGAVVTQNGLNDLPFLYPGDTVTFISEDTFGYVFPESGSGSSDAGAPGQDGKSHVKVLENRSLPDDHQAILKIQIVGNELVQLNNGGSSEYPADGRRYLETTLKYRYVPLWCDIHTETWLGNDHQLSATETATAALYTKEESSTRAWAEDCLTNGYGETQKEVLLTLRRPYIEGLFFTGITFDPGDGAQNRISGEYKARVGDGWHGNFWEGWMDNQVEIHPYLTKYNGGYTDYSGSGSYDDELLVRFKYDYGRTVTFDARGGTIDGYPSRIYEAEGRQYFNEDLQNGKVDEQIAKGTGYVPVREGYRFAGWYEDTAYTTPVTSVKETVNKYSTGSKDSICRIYAKWEKDKPKTVSSITVKGVKYKLSEKTKTATAVGPEKKTAASLTIQDKVSANGKSYKVTAIDTGAFKNMTKLTKVTIGKNVKSIGKKAFYGCKKLKTIDIKTKLLTSKNVKADAFKGIYKKATVKCPKGKAKAYTKWLTKKGVPKTAKIK